MSSLQWGTYTIYAPYEPGISGPLQALPRPEARRAYDRLMEQRSSRIEMLRQLLQINGIQVSLDDGSTVTRLNEWFIANVEGSKSAPGALAAIWYSVVNDIALFLGELAIRRHPNLAWQFKQGDKRNASYQRHVLVGFARPPYPNFDLDIDWSISTYAHRVADGEPENAEYFQEVMTTISEMA